MKGNAGPNPPVQRTAPEVAPPLAEAAIVNGRRWAGYVSGGLGVFIVIVVLCWSGWSINAISNKPPASYVALFGAIAAAVSHIAVSIAAVLFAYQLLRAAERLLVPHWWMQKDNTELLKSFLGMEAPSSRVAKEAEAVSKAVGDSAAKIAKELVPLLKKK